MPGKKILIADESLTIQKVIRLALANEGYEIQAVADAQDLQTQLALFRPDVVLLDASLSGKTAFEIKEVVNKDIELKRCRFVLMSSAFKQIDEGKARDLGFDGRLIKPFDPAHLRQVLQQTLAKAAPAEPKATKATEASLSQDLWEESPPARQPAGPDEDIRMLTESTIKMSGLDDFEWSVQEPLATPPPAPGSAPAAAKSSPSPIEIVLEDREASADEGQTFQFEEPKISPPNPSFFDLSEITMAMDAHPEPAEVELAPTPQAVPVMSSEAVSELVQKQVRAELERLTRQMLPDLAERILKEEIHKLLSEPPA